MITFKQLSAYYGVDRAKKLMQLTKEKSKIYKNSKTLTEADEKLNQLLANSDYSEDDLTALNNIYLYECDCVGIDFGGTFADWINEREKVAKTS